MKTDNELPEAVVNLRKIWNSTKLEMQFTQIEAAKELGWSQGAISHYLNNITELRAPAIVKLANFLSVDPRDIDPKIESKLPSVERRTVAYNACDMTKRINETLFSRKASSSLLVKIPNIEGYTTLFSDGPKPYKECYARLVKPSEMHSPGCYAAILKGEKYLSLYSPDNLPDSSKIRTLWAVVSFTYFK